MINPALAPARFRSILQLEIDPADLYRVNLKSIGFTTTYKTAGTA